LDIELLVLFLAKLGFALKRLPDFTLLNAVLAFELFYDVIKPDDSVNLQSAPGLTRASGPGVGARGRFLPESSRRDAVYDLHTVQCDPQYYGGTNGRPPRQLGATVHFDSRSRRLFLSMACTVSKRSLTRSRLLRTCLEITPRSAGPPRRRLSRWAFFAQSRR